jgi:putative transposase
MTLTQQTIIKQADDFYPLLDSFCFRAKNLYNCTIFKLREAYFNYDAFMSYYSLDKVFKHEKSTDYSDMPLASTAQGTIKLAFTVWSSYWKAIKAYSNSKKNFTGKPKIPRYLHKTKGRSVLFLTNQNVKLIDSVLNFPKCFKGFTLKLPDSVENIQQVRIVPKNRHIVIETVYKKDTLELRSNNSKYLGVDLGLDNFATVVSNDGSQPILINGKGLKSINKYWNKRNAHLKQVADQMNGEWIATKTGRTKTFKGQTKQQAQLVNKRNNQIKDFCHKASKKVVDIALERGCNTIVVGKNVNWKQNSKLSKRVNQSFIQIPYAIFIDMVIYKCELKGLRCICTEESYTSKTSWLDDETPEKQELYLGKRTKRGLFKASNGSLINADVNGALQIVKKVFPKAKADGVWAYVQPLRVNVI